MGIVQAIVAFDHGGTHVDVGDVFDDGHLFYRLFPSKFSPSDETGTSVPIVGTSADATTLITSSKVTGDSFNRYELYADGTVKLGDGTAAPTTYVDELGAEVMDNIQGAFARGLVITNTAVPASQRLNLSYFRARRTKQYTTANFATGGTAAGATPTLVRFGVYSVAANGDITLVASTANDTTLLASPSTAYAKALSAAVTLTGGTWYAMGLLIVTGAALPTINSAGSVLPAATMARSPRLTAAVTGQADLPSSVVAASLTDTGVRLHSFLS